MTPEPVAPEPRETQLPWFGWDGQLMLGLGAFLIFAGSTLAAYWAHEEELAIATPVSYLLGVTLVGALAGLRAGVIAAIAASLTYNFFFSEPVFQFTLASADDYAPLIAFNLCAVASGYVAGRLRDEARLAELSNRRLDALLRFSSMLQGAVEMREVLAEGGEFLHRNAGIALEYYPNRSGQLSPADSGSRHQALAEELWSAATPSIETNGIRAYQVGSRGRRRGVLVAYPADGRDGGQHEGERNAFITMLGIALERCALLEELSQSDVIRKSEEFKTALISSVSHDLRTPLSAISASASSLARYEQELSPGTRSDLLETIQEQCARLNRYTTNLLNLGRIQAGVERSEMPESDALEVLGSAIAQIRRLETGHPLIKALTVDAAKVRADPVMLEQVFYNVLENAVRYTPAEQPVTVTSALSGERLTIAIADCGPGIAEEDLERLFQRFYRGQAKRSKEGTGLGLPIARGFTEAFGGRIRVENASPPLSGAIVTIELPVVADLR